MKKLLILLMLACFYAGNSVAQIDLKNLDLEKIDLRKIDLSNIDISALLGKTINVKKGWAPKFALGKSPIDKIFNVAEIIGIKKNDKANKLFKTFKTGRTIYKVAAYAGAAVAVYGTARSLKNSVKKSEYQTAITTGISSIASGIIVKLLTKGASYKAVDIFNGVATKTIKDILSIKPASETLGVGLYVQL
ncbi:MAG TPA: hypothetical protein PKC62_01845 [Ferruginibacter sp.]|nr:hypothetical protein [Chitinophagaceae bacterium]HMT95404.1 hypothetical protein [Ferruginibacter sp.]HMU23785.1 hypothetical protein [Ferruginibacter sp.]